MKAKMVLAFLAVVLLVVGVNAFFIYSVHDPTKTVWGSALVGGLSGLGLGVFFARQLTRQLSRLTMSAREISAGDLSKEVATSGDDEIAQLGAAFSTMVHQLRDIVASVKTTTELVSRSSMGLSNSAHEMSASAQEIASATEHIAKGAEYQAEYVEKSSGRIKSMATSIEQIASRAREASHSSTEAGYTAQHGGEATGKALDSMREGFERMEAAASAVQGFGERLQKMEKIVEVITGISQQTNLLALNATIEAVRAGDYGKGFGVVAEEVRKLSEKARKSAGDITDLIKEIGKESQKVVSTMAQATSGISSGRESINTVSRSLREIIDTTVEAAGKVQEISVLAQEQAKGADEMVKIMEEVSKIAEDNAAATEEASAATQQLNASMEEMANSAGDLRKTSEELLLSISRFKV